MGRQLSNRAPGSAPARGRLIGFDVYGGFRSMPKLVIEKRSNSYSESICVRKHETATSILQFAWLDGGGAAHMQRP